MQKYLNKTTAILAALAILACGFIGTIVFGLTVLSWHNTASSLRNSYEMKVVANSSELDNLWKKIKQSAQVPEQKKEAFKEIFNSYASSRSTGGENQTMTWIKESVPNVDLKVYDQLMNIITGSRDTWTMKQTELVSIAEQYNALLVSQPKGFFLSVFGHQKIDPKVITSERTEQTFSTGKDDDISLN
jgi:hypothetical protein